jgi:Tol biopolymer transport system component
MFHFRLNSFSAVTFALATLLVASMACSWPWSRTAEPTVAPPPLIGLTPGAGVTGTPDSTGQLPGEATATPDLAATSTPSPQLVALQNMNVRQGPSTQYPIVGYLPQDQTSLIVGQSPDGTWWKIACPAGATGIECWVSGGAQFTTASNTAGVPVAAVPPTPIPAPTNTPAPEPTTPPVAASNPALFYMATGNVWQMSLQVGSGGVSKTADPQQLTNLGNVRRFEVAPDGRRLWLISGTDGNEALSILNLENNQLQTVASTAALPSLPAEYGDVIRIFGAVQWFPNSQKIGFNSYIIGREGPGLGTLNDWWTVDVSGAVAQILPIGQAGAEFAIAPSGNPVLFASATEVLMANADGTNRRNLITFESIITYSEYTYAPRMQWTADGQHAWVAIPSADPLDASAYAQIWRIAADGGTVPFARLLGNVLFNPVQWASNGARLAYVRQIIAPSNPPVQLVLAQGNGDGQTDYGNSVSGSIQFLGWNTTSDRLAYVGTDSTSRQTAYVGTPNGAFVSLPFEPTSNLSDLLWLDATHYVAVVQQGGNTTIYGGNETGAVSPLVSVPTLVGQAAVRR